MNTFRLISRIGLQGLAFVLCGGAMAQGAAPAAGNPFPDENALRGFVSQQVAGTLGEQASRFDVKLGTVDTQQLAPCRKTEPFMPTGARLWGRSSLGLRCVDGATWSVLMPVTVTVWGRAVVAATPLASGTVLQPQDLREQEVDLTREPAGLARDPQQLAGRTLTRNLNPGQTLRADMVRVTTVVQAGDPVRLKVTGSGFSVAAAGQALNSAGEGQPVRVRTELGKIVTGVAREGRQVDLTF